MFNNILATKTVTAIPRAKKRRMAGPSGAAKWDVASQENLALFKARDQEKAEKESKKKQAEEKKKEKEEEKEAKKREKEEQNEERRRQREEKRSLVAARKDAVAAKKAAKKAEKEKEKETQKLDDAVRGPSNTRRSSKSQKPDC